MKYAIIVLTCLLLGLYGMNTAKSGAHAMQTKKATQYQQLALLDK